MTDAAMTGEAVAGEAVIEPGALPLSPPRARLAETVASFGSAAYRNRGARFLARVNAGERPVSFNNIRRMPRWWSLPEDERAPVATLAMLLHYRGKIDQELDGNRLRALVMTTGEALFDLACGCDDHFAPVEALADQPLPIGAEVQRTGWLILHKALPSAFAHNIPDACGDRAALAIADEAAMLWRRHRAHEAEAAA